MSRLARLAVALALVSLAPGCVATTHMYPDQGPRLWNKIAWCKDFETAKKDAGTSNKPILLVVAAGDINSYC